MLIGIFTDVCAKVDICTFDCDEGGRLSCDENDLVLGNAMLPEYGCDNAIEE